MIKVMWYSFLIFKSTYKGMVMNIMMLDRWMIVCIPIVTSMIKVIMIKWLIIVLMLIYRTVMMSIVIYLLANIISWRVTPINLEWFLPLQRVPLVLLRVWRHLTSILPLLLDSSLHKFLLLFHPFFFKFCLRSLLILILLRKIRKPLLLHLHWPLISLLLIFKSFFSKLLIVFLLVNCILSRVILAFKL